MLSVRLLPASPSPGVSVLERVEHDQFTMKRKGPTGFFSHPTSTGGNFLLSEESGKGNCSSSFSQSFPFLNSEPLQETFIIFPPRGSLPAAPLQSWSSPIWIYPYQDTSPYQDISPYQVISADVSGTRGWESQQTLPEPFPTSLTAPRRIPSSKSNSRLFLIVSWVFTAKQRQPI